LLKAALELNPERELLLTTLDQYGMNRLQAADYPMAARIFEQMLAMPGLPPQDRVNTLFRISAAYASIKDLGAARRALTEALRMVPEEPQLLSRLALVEAADGKLDVAEELLRNALERLQGNPELEIETRLQLAGVCAQAGKWDKAIEQYRLAADTEGADAETIRLARMGLSNACVQNGDMAQGEKIMEEIYNEDPSDPGVNNDLGYLWADQGKNLEQAEKMIRLAVEAQPENPAYLDSLGWVLFKQGRLEEALVPLVKANADPDYQDSTLLEHQGDVHQALKQPAEAKAMWERALKVEQDASRSSEDVLKRLKEKLAAPADPATSGEATPDSN
jgi:tetratricopeptide (TPR) repeat protein